MREIMGGSRGILIRTGRCDSEYRISVSCRNQGGCFNLWCIALPNGRGLCMSAWNGSERKRKAVYHDGIYTKSNCAGGNRWNPAGTWICMWGRGSDSSSTCNCTDGAAWSICD